MLNFVCVGKPFYSFIFFGFCFLLSRSKLTNELSFAVLIVPSNAATSVIVVFARFVIAFAIVVVATLIVAVCG